MGMTKTVNTNVFKGDVLNFAHAEMAREFDLHAAVMAGLSPEKFNHVYEWRMTGKPAAQLWRHKLTGPMNNKLASFEWIASTQPILTPRERQNNPNDRMSNVSGEDIAKYSSRRYIFRWKAPMMEYMMETVITPRWAKRLVFPEVDWSGKLRVTTGPIFKTAGGENTHGSFSTLWAEWWSSQADQVFERSVGKIVEEDMADSVRNAMRRNKSSRVTVASISTVATASAAMAAGRAMAETYLKSRSRSYRASSNYLRERYG